MGPFDGLLLSVLLAATAIVIGGFLLRAAPIRKVRHRGHRDAQLGGARVRRAFEAATLMSKATGPSMRSGYTS
jgi:hypothetical protein